MSRIRAGADVEIFSTCLPSRNEDSASYLERVAQLARWSDGAGYRGMLVYTDNGLVDPWLVAQIILQSTERLCPLVAVQPVYSTRTPRRRWWSRSASSTRGGST
jgi:alkanesulfonate monooxygenase